jgi:hypothetical protein
VTKRLFALIAILLVLAAVAFAFQQNQSERKTLAFKRGPSGYPKEAMVKAQNILGETGLIHLSGKVEISIFTADKERVVIRAESATYDRQTGEVKVAGESTALVERIP